MDTELDTFLFYTLANVLSLVMIDLLIYSKDRQITRKKY